MKSISRILIAFVLAGMASLPAAMSAKTIKVVTTLAYLDAVTKAIGGEYVTSTALANPKQDPHYVTPSPAMNQLASDADLFIENGLSLDLWAKNVVDASGNPGIQTGSPGHLIATINVPVKELPTEVSRSWGDIHPQGNPHVWLDPLNITIIAGNIADRLKQIDPAHAAAYEKNLQTFRDHLNAELFGGELLKAVGKSAGEILTRKARLGSLMDWLKSKKLDGKLGGWMKMAQNLNGVKVVTYHKTYVYFADRFGIQLAGELEEKPGIPPPPQHRDEVVEMMKREGIRVILNDNFYSREAADYIAGRTGAHVIITYVDVGGIENVDTYDKLITYLLEEIQQAIH